MTANEITFGIEIECSIPRDAFVAAGIQPGGYHNGRQIPGMPIGWNAQRDGSIRPARGCYAVEIVSPILKGEDGVRQVREVVANLNALGAKVNRSTGFHVHVGVDRNADALRKLIRLMAQYEKAFYATTGTHTREQNHYCGSIKSPYFALKDITTIEEIATIHHNRYQSLNLMNLVHGELNTVEFRAFAGTLNVIKILGYIQLCIGLVEKAAAFKCDPCYKSATKCRATEPTTGVGSVAKLLRILKWSNKGGFGVIASDTVDEIKVEFARLAKKYDRSAVQPSVLS